MSDTQPYGFDPAMSLQQMSDALREVREEMAEDDTQRRKK